METIYRTRGSTLGVSQKWLPPSRFEAAFLSVAHTPQDIESTIAAAKEAPKQA